MEITRRMVWLGMFLIAVCLVSTACSDDPSTPAVRAIHYVVFADGSASVNPAQVERWTNAAKTLVLDRLHGGDALVVYPLNDRTDEVAPVFDEEFPTLDEDAGVEATIWARDRFAELLKKADAKIAGALKAPERALQTKILAGLRRIPHDTARETLVIVLSDAQESTPALDLEKTALTDRNRVPIAEAAFARERWRRDMLANTRIQFVLDSPGVNQKTPVNGHFALEQFWRLMLQSAGAQLVSFDSRVAN